VDILACRAGVTDSSTWQRPTRADTAVFLLSSGSMGTAKVVPLTRGGLADFAAGNRRALDWRSDEVTLSWLPVDHSGAFLLYHLLPVFLGSSNIHIPTKRILADPLRWHTWDCASFLRGRALESGGLCCMEAAAIEPAASQLSGFRPQ
jgi:acyl-CoA synthetase (AMP-forming)/AMP-acid ligase II